MNKLINTDLGGFPFVLDDLRFMDDANREAFKGSFFHLIDSSLVSDGFLFDKNSVFSAGTIGYITGNLTFPESFCYIDGEIYLIPETILSASFTDGYYYKLEVDTSFDSAGTKTFESTAVNETYQIRRAKLTYTNTIVAGTDIPVMFDDTSGFLGAGHYLDRNFTFFGRMAQKLGVEDLGIGVSLLSGGLSTQQSKMANIEGAWSTITSASILPKLYYNASSNPADYGTDNPFTSAPALTLGASSWLKYKKNGKTLHLDFNLIDLEFPSVNGKYSVGSWNIDLTGLVPSISSVKDFNAVLMAFNNDFEVSGSVAISGSNVHASAHGYKTKSIIFKLMKPYEDSVASWNTSYDSTAIPMVGTTNADLTQMKWRIQGQITLEIS